MNTLFNKTNNFKKYANISSNLIFGTVITDIKISILMPVYRNADFFEEALVSAINQDFSQNYNIIIVDNNEDNLESDLFFKCANKYKNSGNILFYKNEKNIGMTGNWNRCIELSTAPVFVFLHDDDILKCNALTELYKIFMDVNKTVYPTNTLVGEKTNKIIQNNTLIYKTSLYDAFLGINVSHNCGTLFIRNQILEIGGYSEDYYPCSDWALNVQVVNYFGSVHTTQELVCIRKAENTSSEVYKQFAPMLYKIRGEMISKFYLVKIFLLILRKSLKKYDGICAEIEWGKNLERKQLPIYDRIIIRIAYAIQRRKCNVIN